MDAMKYRDTREADAGRPLFSEVVVKGIADGGGLYVPESLPAIDVDGIVSLASMPYHERAATVFRTPGTSLGEDWSPGGLHLTALANPLPRRSPRG